MAPPSSVSFTLLPVELLLKLVRDHLPEWQDRRALRRTCRDFRAVVDGVVDGVTLDCMDLEGLLSGTTGSSSGRLLRQLKRLNVRGRACRDPEAVCWRFGALHLSMLTQLTRLELRDEDVSTSSSTTLPLLRLVTCAPASLRHLRLHFSGCLGPVDALAAFASLATRCPALEKLVLQPRLEAASLPALAAHAWPQLRSLDIALNVHGLDGPAELLTLASLTQLTRLAVRHVSSEDAAEGLAALSELVNLRDLELEGVAGLHYDGEAAPDWPISMLAGATALTRLVLLPEPEVFPEPWESDHGGFPVQLPRAAFAALPHSLVALRISDNRVRGEEASALAELPRLAALTAQSVTLDAAAAARFAALTRLEVMHGGFALEGAAAPAAVAAAAETAFPALEWYSGELDGAFPALPRLHTAALRLNRTGKPAGLARCGALRRLQLDDWDRTLRNNLEVRDWPALPAVQSLKVGIQHAVSGSYLDHEFLAALVGTFPGLTVLEFFVARQRSRHAPYMVSADELAFAPLLALPRLASLHLYSMSPSLTRAALAQLVAGAPVLQRLAVSFAPGGHRGARPEVTRDFLAALARSVRQRAVRCELLSSRIRWETRW